MIKLIGKKPSLEYTLDRIESDKGYYPDNIQWATRKEQARNRQNSTRLAGISISAREGSSQYNIGKDSFVKLARQGFDEDGILFYSGLSFKEKKQLKILALRLS